jgi:hypothetical protein
MGIPRTYYDGNPEDRAYIPDFWTWLQQQPQTAWLYYARKANWDEAGEMFVDMVRHPHCERALASWLFWSSDPSYFIEQGKRPPAGTLVGAILERSEKGGFSNTGLFYHRVEVALQALRAAEALTRLDGPPSFRIPRELCASFEGRNPDLPPFDATTERDLEEMFEYLDGTLPRTDQDSWEWNKRGGNWWYEQALQLPPTPEVTARMSDVEAIDAVFGEHRSTLARIERARMNLNARARRPEADSPEQSVGARWGLSSDPKQRVIGLVLLIVSVLLLIFLLFAKLR